MAEKWFDKAEFCRQKGVNILQFSYHSIKHHAFSQSREAEKIEPDSFVEVVRIEKTSTSAPVATPPKTVNAINSR
jgi:hypothetical protein